MIFRDRTSAGRMLAAELMRFRGENPIVLGLPRGGVPVAYEVARSLAAPLDVWVVRKIGAPVQPELGVGAVAETGELVLHPSTMALAGVSEEEARAIGREEQREITRRVRRFRGNRPRPDVRGRTVIVVDDGVATGGTVQAALRSLRRLGPNKIVLAVPVGASETLQKLESEADEIVCLEPARHLFAIGTFYEDFTQTTDDDVVELLRRAREASSAEPSGPPGRASAPRIVERDVSIPAGDLRASARLAGRLSVPENARGIVLFAHGSGSSRFSPRNRFVAEVLQARGLGTLLFDLLTADEEQEDALTGHLRFDIELLARRLVAATDWIADEPGVRGLPLGYFGASTGAAAALIAATRRPDIVRAVVSRGGRPDLAWRILARVEAPTRLIVGAEDDQVVALNEEALSLLRGTKDLVIVPGATHLFEEPGTLESAAQSAAEWFARYLEPGQLRATA